MNAMTDQEVRDREAIRDLMMRYAAGLDRRDFAMVAACFTRDAHASYSGVDVGSGVDKIIAHVRPLARLKSSTHFIGNQFIKVEGDRAEMETYATAHLVETKDGRDTMRIRGIRYMDRLVRQDGRWLIADRVHTCDWMYDVPVTAPGNPPPPGPRRP